VAFLEDLAEPKTEASSVQLAERMSIKITREIRNFFRFLFVIRPFIKLLLRTLRGIVKFLASFLLFLRLLLLIILQDIEILRLKQYEFLFCRFL
jgi:hypothetical protein